MSGKLTLILSIITLLILGVTGVAQQGQVEPMEKRPVFTVKVVSRTTKAVNYRHRGGSTKVDLEGTELMLEARGETSSCEALQIPLWGMPLDNSGRVSRSPSRAVRLSVR